MRDAGRQTLDAGKRKNNMSTPNGGQGVHIIPKLISKNFIYK